MTPPTAPERCPTCDRPVATKAHWAERDSRGGRSGIAVRDAMRDIEKRDGVCMVTGWIHGCAKHAAPWRARAIAAEARWAKVAPLIERLRAECGEPPFRGRVPNLIECAAAILAATEAAP